MTAKEYQELIKTQNGSKRNKYGNVKVYLYENGAVESFKRNGEKPVAVFDSEKEYRRYKELQLLERAHEIRELKRQVEIIIQENFSKDGSKISAIKYKADFTYYDKSNAFVVEDVKPFDENTGKYRTTKDFNLKWKLMKFKFPEYKFVIY